MSYEEEDIFLLLLQHVILLNTYMSYEEEDTYIQGATAGALGYHTHTHTHTYVYMQGAAAGALSVAAAAGAHS